MGWLDTFSTVSNDIRNAYDVYGLQSVTLDIAAESIGLRAQQAWRDVDSIRNDDVVQIRADRLGENNLSIRTGIDGSTYQVNPNDMDHSQYSYAINFNHIIEQGELNNSDGGNIYQKTYEFDLDADDSFATAMREIEQNTIDRIQQNPDLQELLAKDEWTMEDREVWEASVAQIVTEEVDNIPGLNSYRTYDPNNRLNYPADMQAGQDISSFNDLSVDIDNNTTTFEFDCDKMAVVEGIILQNVDNQFLPEDSDVEGDMRVAADYFHVTADVDYQGLTGPLSLGSFQEGYGYHAFIISSATGNIVEATADPSMGQNAYIQSQEGFTFENFVDGEAFVERGGQGAVYAGYLSGGEAVGARSAEVSTGAMPVSNPTLVEPPPIGQFSFNQMLVTVSSEAQLYTQAMEDYNEHPDIQRMEDAIARIQERTENGETIDYDDTDFREAIDAKWDAQRTYPIMERQLDNTIHRWEMAADLVENDPQRSEILLDSFNTEMAELLEELDGTYGLETVQGPDLANGTLPSMAEQRIDVVTGLQQRLAENAGLDPNSQPNLLPEPVEVLASIDIDTSFIPQSIVEPDVSELPPLASMPDSLDQPEMPELANLPEAPELPERGVSEMRLTMEHLTHMDMAAQEIRERFEERVEGRLQTADENDHLTANNMTNQAPEVAESFVENGTQVVTDEHRTSINVDFLQEQDWQADGDGLKIVGSQPLDQVEQALQEAGIAANATTTTIGNTTIHGISIGEAAADRLQQLFDSDDPAELLADSSEMNETLIKDQDWQAARDGGMRVVSTGDLDEVLAALQEEGIDATLNTSRVGSTEVNAIVVDAEQIQQLQTLIGSEQESYQTAMNMMSP